eukprot:CAMPEP_0117669776 /NCGR_PEP_ID=MMETSP0804-20121206/12339_1 /TAXON_ID=1074897 /ORGANISM="Tetraselmis astigmatica, Strain CCMP880" /LENGTH=289 /DNA_ID=CAMNT_0005477909 /DNA_START=105 /DNA_END=974 /DNA_ORIENTATION=-
MTLISAATTPRALGHGAASRAHRLARRARSCCLRVQRPAQPREQRFAGDWYFTLTEVGCRSRSVAASVSTDREVEGATREFCNDDECNSSPQVEENVRSIANDIELNRWSTRTFQTDCQYSDIFRSFKGVEKYQRFTFVKDMVENPRATVLLMKMVDKSHSVITWRLKGSLQGQALDVKFTDEFQHNQLTGRVSVHKQSWEAAAGGIAFNTSRAGWSAAQTQADVSQLISESLDELTGNNKEDEFMRDPNDPTKFFQKPDDGMNDMIQYALFVAVLYLVFQAYSAINQM